MNTDNFNYMEKYAGRSRKRKGSSSHPHTNTQVQHPTDKPNVSTKDLLQLLIDIKRETLQRDKTSARWKLGKTIAANTAIAAYAPNAIDGIYYGTNDDTLKGIWRYITPGAYAINAINDSSPSTGRKMNAAAGALTAAVGPLLAGISPASMFISDAVLNGGAIYKANSDAAETRAKQEHELKLAEISAAKDSAAAAGAAAKAQKELIDDLKRFASEQASMDKWKTILGLGAGALAMGGAGYALYKWLGDREEERQSRTRMKMKLETPDGKDAIVDLPINNPELSGKLAEEFNKGVTRSVRRTARHNSLKKDPETNKFIPYPEFQKKYPNGIGTTGDEYTQKSANLINMPQDNLVDNFALTTQRKVETGDRSAMVRNFLDSFELQKEAAGRDTQAAQLSEIFGSIAAPTLAGIGTGYLANKKLGLSLGLSLALGTGAALTAPVLGMVASALTPNRTIQEQADHDTGYHGLLNAIIPGYAQFNLVQRANMLSNGRDSLKELDAAITAITGDGYDNKPVVKNKNLTDNSPIQDDDDDF